MSSAHPTRSTLALKNEMDGMSLADGFVDVVSRDSYETEPSYTSYTDPIASDYQLQSFGAADNARKVNEELDKALMKLKLLEELASDTHSDDTFQTEQGTMTLSERRETDSSTTFDQLRTLRTQLSQREAEITSLRAVFEENWSREQRLYQRIRQLESVLSSRCEAMPRREEVMEQLTALPAKSNCLTTTPSTNSSLPNINDTVIVDKLNLAYEDLSAIYDLRMDIDHQLNELHHGLIDPVLRKQIIKLIREKELALRLQHLPK